MKALLILFTTFLMTSCAFEDIQMLGVQNVNVDEFNTDRVQITTSIKLRNPNNYKIKIKKSELALYVNGTTVGTTKLRQKIVLPKNSTLDHDFVIESTIKDVAISGVSGVLGVLQSGGVRLGVDGYVKGSAFLISMKIPVEVEENVSLDGGLFGF